MTTATRATTRTAVDVKDMLFDLLYDAESTREFFQAADKVLSTIELTAGMWVEFDYAYKAGEICEAIARRCNDILFDMPHHATCRKAEEIKARAWSIQDDMRADG